MCPLRSGRKAAQSCALCAPKVCPQRCRLRAGTVVAPRAARRQPVPPPQGQASDGHKPAAPTAPGSTRPRTAWFPCRPAAACVSTRGRRRRRVFAHLAHHPADSLTTRAARSAAPWRRLALPSPAPSTTARRRAASSWCRRSVGGLGDVGPLAHVNPARGRVAAAPGRRLTAARKELERQVAHAREVGADGPLVGVVVDRRVVDQYVAAAVSVPSQSVKARRSRRRSRRAERRPRSPGRAPRRRARPWPSRASRAPCRSRGRPAGGRPRGRSRGSRR